MARNTEVISVSLPRAMRTQLKRVAKREGRSQSEVLRDAFRFQQSIKRLRGLQRVGRARALELGIESDEDVVRFLSHA